MQLIREPKILLWLFDFSEKQGLDPTKNATAGHKIP
jgi:hypothetical protein